MLPRDAFRLSGASLVLGASALFVSSVLLALLFPNDDPLQATQPTRVALDLLNALATALVLLGLPGAFARWMHGYGALGLVGTVLAALSLMLFGFFGLLSGLVLPSLVAHDAQPLTGTPDGVIPLGLLGLACGTLGPILLAIPSIRGRVSARWIGWAWLLCGVLAAIGFFTSGPDSAMPEGIITGLINQSSTLFGAAAVFGLGVHLLQDPTPHPAVASARTPELAPMSS
jgi:hypothetical protein